MKKMQKIKIKTVFFGIPDTSLFPRAYRGGSVEVGVFPASGVLPFVLDTQDGLERLKEWAINNVLRGFIAGHYTEASLREGHDIIKAVDQNGKVLLDTFLNEYEYEPYSPKIDEAVVR